MTYSTAMAKLRTEADAGDQARMCAAKGCPNAWSAETGKGRLCSAHAWAEPHDWPEITQRQVWAENDRAMAYPAADEPAELPLAPVDMALLAERLDQLHQVFRSHQPQPKAWAQALRLREERGDALTLAQRQMWRAALGRPQSLAADRSAP